MRFKSLITKLNKSEKVITPTVNETKFNKLINSYKLNEQVGADPNAAVAQDAALDPTAAQTAEVQQQPPQPAEPPEQEETEKLTSEGEVELIRLLRKALTLDIDANKMPVEVLNADINKNNAREIYEKIKSFMSTYTD